MQIIRIYTCRDTVFRIRAIHRYLRNVNNESRTSIATSLAEIIFDETTDSIVLICVAERDCYFVFRRKLNWIILIAIIDTIESILTSFNHSS